MKVIIVGAGLGGLACAIACRRENNINVTVLERTPEIQQAGAGIQVPPNGTRIMRDLGLLDQLLEKGTVVQQVDFRRYKDGRLLRSMPFGDEITKEFGAPWLVIHRVDYHRILLDEATRLGVEIRLGASVEDVSINGPEVILSGGEKESGDLIIGADGINSTIRSIIHGSSISPIETGDLAYRAVFKRSQLEFLNDDSVNELCQKVGVTSYLGPDKHTIFYPVRGGEEFNLVLIRPDNLAKGLRREEAEVEEMRESYAGWHETLQKIISCVPSVYKWKLTNLAELPSWSKGNVTLLGDACHPTLPYQAQGAAMAVEDGEVIGKLLGLLSQKTDPTPENLSSVLKVYEQIRKKSTTQKVQGAVKNRKMFHIKDGFRQSTRDFMLKFTGVTRKSDKTWLSSHRQRRSLKGDVLEKSGKAFEGWDAKR